MRERFDYCDLSGLATASRAFLYAQAAGGLVSALSAWWTWTLLAGMAAGDPISNIAVEQDDARVAAIALVMLLLYIVGGVIVLLWISRANRNAHAIGTLEMETTPGWAVGWYFVPFANLVMPFRSMREIGEASASALPGAAPPSGALLGCWWACWLAGNIAGFVSVRIAWEAEGLEALRVSAGFDIAASLLTVPACLLLAAIITRIKRLQNRAVPAIELNEQGIQA